jgi:hypothetical protein
MRTQKPLMIVLPVYVFEPASTVMPVPECVRLEEVPLSKMLEFIVRRVMAQLGRISSPFVVVLVSEPLPAAVPMTNWFEAPVKRIPSVASILPAVSTMTWAPT